MLPVFFHRCLAHFPPADTYESDGKVNDVSNMFHHLTLVYQVRYLNMKIE